MTQKLLRYFAIAIASIVLTVACNSDSQLQNTQVAEPQSSTADEVLEIWWDKGYYPEEDEALRQVVSRWERKTNSQAQLYFYTNDELSIKTERAIQAGSPPDVLMNDGGDRTIGFLAWSGKLADVSEVIEPVKELYDDTILSSAALYNNIEQKRSYYAVPIHVSIPHIFYWRSLLQKIGKSDKPNGMTSLREVPNEWDDFWQFWQQTQQALRNKQEQNIYSIGLPLSVAAVDTYEIFEQILEAYDVATVDERGNLQVARPEVRQGIINCLDWYTQFYLQGYVPPEAVNWLNPDNNRSLLNREVVMTPNNSLSIPAALGRNTDAYKNDLVTAAYPNKPSGQPMQYIALVRQAIVLADAPHPELAKEFLSYLIQPKVIGNYLKAAGGRFFPVNNRSWSDTFWNDSADPHISTAAKPLQNKQTRLSYTSLNPAYSLVLKKGIWGQALNRIVIDNISPEQAADEAIAKIEEIFQTWDNKSS